MQSLRSCRPIEPVRPSGETDAIRPQVPDPLSDQRDANALAAELDRLLRAPSDASASGEALGIYLGDLATAISRLDCPLESISLLNRLRAGIAEMPQRDSSMQSADAAAAVAQANTQDQFERSLPQLGRPRSARPAHNPVTTLLMHGRDRNFNDLSAIERIATDMLVGPTTSNLRDPDVAHLAQASTRCLGSLEAELARRSRIHRIAQAIAQAGRNRPEIISEMKYSQRSYSLHRAGCFTEALALAIESAEDSPADITRYSELASIHATMGNAVAVHLTVERGLKALAEYNGAYDPSCCRAMLAHAACHAYILQGNLAGAAGELQHASRLDQRYLPDVLTVLGNPSAARASEARSYRQYIANIRTLARRAAASVAGGPLHEETCQDIAVHTGYAVRFLAWCGATDEAIDLMEAVHDLTGQTVSIRDVLAAYPGPGSANWNALRAQLRDVVEDISSKVLRA